MTEEKCIFVAKDFFKKHYRYAPKLYVVI